MSSEQSRSLALEEARKLLLEEGPQAVTLKAVGARIGRTHANLLHHFGTAAGLQQELATYIADKACIAIKAAFRESREGSGTTRDVVDMTFEAFGREGGGAIVGWLLLTGNEAAFAPVAQTIHKLVDEMYPSESAHDGNGPMHRASFSLMLMSLGDALIGERLAKVLSVDRDSARERATEMMVAARSESERGLTG